MPVTGRCSNSPSGSTRSSVTFSPGPMSELDDREHQARVVEAGRVLAANGHADLVLGTCVLARRATMRILDQVTGTGFEELYDTDIQLVDFDGKVLVGAGDPHMERFIHSEILLRTSPDSPRPGTGSAHRQWAAPSHGRWANAMPFCW
ncbi:class II aldolase/adducin family protein [Nocardia abscessus]|uniref:class II aldolase/adducin family protein n=1 Tax=Nocardia abscessus TaxID=120957 RepID=UPI003CC7DF63